MNFKFNFYYDFLICIYIPFLLCPFPSVNDLWGGFLVRMRNEIRNMYLFLHRTNGQNEDEKIKNKVNKWRNICVSSYLCGKEQKNKHILSTLMVGCVLIGIYKYYINY